MRERETETETERERESYKWRDRKCTKKTREYRDYKTTERANYREGEGEREKHVQKDRERQNGKSAVIYSIFCLEKKWIVCMWAVYISVCELERVNCVGITTGKRWSGVCVCVFVCVCVCVFVCESALYAPSNLLSWAPTLAHTARFTQPSTHSTFHTTCSRAQLWLVSRVKQLFVVVFT